MNRNSAFKAVAMASTAIGLLFSTNVFAQTASDGGISDVVVTAQRKVSTAQKSAIAIDAIGGQDLADKGITDAFALSKAVPAVTVNSGGGSNSSIMMRGVGNRTTSAYADPAIAISFDGVFMGRSSAASGSVFFDLERVEVLKGPQGILYGRNATGGAINLLPAKPRLGSNSGSVTLGFGNYQAQNVQGYVNLALGDNHALRIAGTYDKHEGYNTDGTDDADNAGIRIQLAGNLNDNVNYRISADHLEVGGLGAGGNYMGHYTPGATYTFVPSNLPVGEGIFTSRANTIVIQFYRLQDLVS